MLDLISYHVFGRTFNVFAYISETLIILSKSWPNQSSSSRENAKKTKCFVTVKEKFFRKHGMKLNIAYRARIFFFCDRPRIFNVFAYILETNKDLSESGDRRVYTDSWKVVIGICGWRPPWQRCTRMATKKYFPRLNSLDRVDVYFSELFR